LGLCIGECGGEGGDCGCGGCVIGTEVCCCAEHVGAVGVSVLHIYGGVGFSGAVRVVFISVKIIFIYVILDFFGVIISFVSIIVNFYYVNISFVAVLFNFYSVILIYYSVRFNLGYVIVNFASVSIILVSAMFVLERLLVVCGAFALVYWVGFVVFIVEDGVSGGKKV